MLHPFDPSSHGSNIGVSLQPDGKAVLFGFNSYRRLNADDTADGTFQSDASLGTFDFLSPGLAGKHFVLSDGAAAVLEDSVIRQIRENGLADSEFQFGLKFSEIATAEQRYKVYVGQNRPMTLYDDGRFLFRYFDNTGAYRLGRFNPNGSVDSTFTTSSVPALAKSESVQTITGGSVQSEHSIIEASATAMTDVLLLPDGKVIVVGMFREYNGAAAPAIVRLEQNGAVDSTFKAGRGAEWIATQPDATHVPRIDAIERLADGSFLITGDFEAYDGSAVPGIARLNADGSLDRAFVPPVARQNSATTPTGSFAPTPVSQLITETGGTVLLTSNYAPVGSDSPRSIIRLKGLTSTVPLNISTRLNVRTGDNVIIGGFIVTGNAPKKVIVRALGPSLQASGVGGALPNPTLELRGAGGVIASNDDWRDAQQSEIDGSGVPPQHELESAIVRTLDPGAYTAIVRGNGGATGVGLVELYDLDQAADSQLANISTRGFVETGENVMIGGFILGGSASSTNVLVRALGPSLGTNGVQGALQDTMLELRDRDGAIVAENDDWKATQRAAIEATTIPPSRDEEAAIFAPLPAGAYTAIVRGKDGSSGVGLVEVYNVQ